MYSNKIICDNLTKTFQYRKKIWGMTQHIDAVKNLSFELNAGEFVALIGPNGGGKSTTVKMLTSILHPTSGTASVFGINPWKERNKLCYKIGAVFGQKSQLYFHLSPMDTFRLLSTAYDLPTREAKQRISQLSDLFQVSHLLTKPVRQLSLGERMRCEIIASLIHRPHVLFLDEPSIGLDITAKQSLRTFLKKQTDEEGTTIFLTSHDTGDIESMCSRVLLINKGQLMINSSLDELKKQYMTEKEICYRTEDGLIHTIKINTKTDTIEKQIRRLMKETSFTDISIREPDLDTVIASIYRGTHQ